MVFRWLRFHKFVLSRDNHFRVFLVLTLSHVLEIFDDVVLCYSTERSLLSREIRCLLLTFKKKCLDFMRIRFYDVWEMTGLSSFDYTAIRIDHVERGILTSDAGVISDR